VPGNTGPEYLKRLQEVLQKPVGLYFREWTHKAVGIAAFIYLVAVLMYESSRHNLMPGREHGTAHFMKPEAANALLSDKRPHKNRILSAHVKMSTDGKKTKLNNNLLVIGGSGAGKSFYCVRPNILEMDGSIVVTDPKGELLASTGGFLKKNGYDLKVLNLVEMEKSDQYNPFVYIREETDVVKLITNLIANTTPKGANKSDPFWEKAESLYLQALFYYVWMELPKEEQNFNSLLKLLDMAEVNEGGKKSKLDELMAQLELKSELGENHPAVKQYKKCIRGAGDTVRSIIISANSRLAFLENENVKRILSDDVFDLAALGVGKNRDKKTKTAVFCVIPDSDKSYNFIVGMLYTQLFQVLYYEADFNYKGKLPIPVTCWFDEFANVALPDDFCSLLSTMRSRDISSVIIIQNMAQIKALFQDTWETIPGNCDSLLYLGGNEQSTHKYISEMLGKATIDKRSTGENRGRMGGSSRNYDVLGRELLAPDEVRKLDNRKCILFIRGLDPILDAKYNPMEHENFKETAEGGAKRYVHEPAPSKDRDEPLIQLDPESIEAYQSMQEAGEEVYIDTMTAEQFLALTKDVPLFSEVPKGILNSIRKNDFTEEQLKELELGAGDGLTEQEILAYMKPELSAEKMKEIRLTLMKNGGNK
jgi:type IV secretion system protein VirD4